MRRIAQRWPRFLPLLQRLCLAAVLLAAAQAALVHPFSHLGHAHGVALALQDGQAPADHGSHSNHSNHSKHADQAAGHPEPAIPEHAPGCDTCAALHALAFLADAAEAGPDYARLAQAAAVRLPAAPRTAERRAPFASRAPPLA